MGKDNKGKGASSTKHAGKGASSAKHAGKKKVVAKSAPAKKAPKVGAPKTVRDKIIAVVRAHGAGKHCSRSVIKSNLKDIKPAVINKTIAKCVGTDVAVLDMKGDSFKANENILSGECWCVVVVDSGESGYEEHPSAFWFEDEKSAKAFHKECHLFLKAFHCGWDNLDQMVDKPVFMKLNNDRKGKAPVIYSTDVRKAYKKYVEIMDGTHARN